MKVRPISQDELEPFVNTSKVDRQVLQKHLLHAWSEGTSKPEWCFAAEAENSFTGGIAYETDNKTGNLAIFHLDTVDELDDLAIKRALIRHSLQEFRREQTQVVQYRLSTDPTPEGLAVSRPLIDIVKELGFECMRERIEFERPGNSPSVAATNRLAFRTREEVGELTFSQSFALSFQDSLDSEILKGYTEVGPQRVISQYLSECPKEDERNAWFSELAYDAQNDLVGVIMLLLSQKRKNPRKDHSIGCIYTLGVVPKKRGQGYVNDLLARGTQILEHEGADCIRSTTAATNFPMVNAFERAHYKQTEHWWGFEIHLNSKI